MTNSLHENKPDTNDELTMSPALTLEGRWLLLSNGIRIERSQLANTRVERDQTADYYRNKPSPISFFITLISAMALYAMFRADTPEQWPFGQATLIVSLVGLACGIGLVIRSVRASRLTLVNLILPQTANHIVLLQTDDEGWANQVQQHCLNDDGKIHWLIDNNQKRIIEVR